MRIFTFLLLLVPFVSFGQGSEDFTNSTATGTYADNSFVGNDGLTWTFGHSRDEGTFPIDANGLMLRNALESYLEITIPNGVGNFAFQYRKAFTGGSPRQLELLVDGLQVGTTPEFGATSGEETTVYDFDFDVNQAGSVTLRIKNVGATSTNKQIILDNIVWTALPAGCNISGAGLTAVTCNDNGTPLDALDDYVSFSLDPTGADLGTDYSVAVSSGTISPLTATYGAPTAFQLQNGSAGAGDVTVTITDDTDLACTLDVIITDPGICSSAVPVITLNPTSLTGFTQVVGTPSAEQQFSASGIGLIDDILLTAPANYEISLTSGAGFTNSIILPESGGTVTATDIYVRANALAYGAINESIIGSSTGATNATVDLEGFADDYIVYTISEVSTVDVDGVADSLGVLVELTGIVHCMDFDGNAGYSITLIDENNDGINMFNFADISGYTTPMAGDSLTVRGVIGQFNGLLQVEVDSVNVLAQGAATMAPTVVTTLDETTESQYITMMGLTLVTPVATFPTGSNNIDVTDGVNTFTMRIDDDTDIPGAAAPMGTFNLTGVGGQFDNSSPYSSGYQIFPCGTSSFETVCDGTNTPDNSVTVTDPTITAVATGVTYQWIDCFDDSEIIGETGMSYTATATGEYAVVVDNGTCSDTSVCTLIDLSGVNEVNTIGLSVHPNPTSGVLTIRFEGNAGELRLTDLAGKTALTATIESNDSIDLSELSAGTYLLNLTVNGVVTTERISVK